MKISNLSVLRSCLVLLCISIASTSFGAWHFFRKEPEPLSLLPAKYTDLSRACQYFHDNYATSLPVDDLAPFSAVSAAKEWTSMIPTIVATHLKFLAGARYKSAYFYRKEQVWVNEILDDMIQALRLDPISPRVGPEFFLFQSHLSPEHELDALLSAGVNRRLGASTILDIPPPYAAQEPPPPRYRVLPRPPVYAPIDTSINIILVRSLNVLRKIDRLLGMLRYLAQVPILEMHHQTFDPHHVNYSFIKKSEALNAPLLILQKERLWPAMNLIKETLK